MERIKTRPEGADFKAIINRPFRDEMAELTRQLSIADNEGMFDRRESEPVELKEGVAGALS